MSTGNQNPALSLASANQAAQRNFSGEELSSPIATCPASQAEVLIVPVRYALAEQAAEHPSLQPATPPQSHPLALRRLRAGYLYLWHHQGPLQRYAVAGDGLLMPQGLDDPHSSPANGSQAGLALDKQHDAWLLYSEHPLPAPGGTARRAPCAHAPRRPSPSGPQPGGCPLPSPRQRRSATGRADARSPRTGPCPGPPAERRRPPGGRRHPGPADDDSPQPRKYPDIRGRSALASGG